MKYLKILGLMAVAAAALMALVGPGTASATVLCKNEACTETYGAGTKLSSQLEGEAVMSSSFIGQVKCKESTTEGEIENSGSSTETVSGTVTGLTFSSCNAKVVVLKKGSIESHTAATEANNNGTATSSGSEITIELAGLHCIFSTSNTDVGKIVGGSASETAINSATIPRTGGRSGAFCGSSASFSARYGEVSPGAIYVK